MPGALAVEQVEFINQCSFQHIILLRCEGELTISDQCPDANIFCSSPDTSRSQHYYLCMPTRWPQIPTMYCNATLGLLGVDREAPVSPSRSRRKSSHSDLHIFRQARAPGRSLHAAQPRALPVRTAHPCRHVQWSVRLPAPVGTSANNAAAPASPALWPTGAPVAFQLSLVSTRRYHWFDLIMTSGWTFLQQPQILKAVGA